MTKSIAGETGKEIDSVLQLEQLNLFPGGAGIIYLYKDGKIEVVYFNDSYYETLNTTREKRSKYEGFNFLDAVYPEDRVKFKDTLETALHQPKAEIELRIKKDTDCYCWLSIKCSVLKVCPDKTTMLLNSVDISKLKHMEEKFLDIEKTMGARIKLEEERIKQDETQIYAYSVSDLTNGVVLNCSNNAPNAPIVEQTTDYDENVKAALNTITYDDDRERFAQTHNRAYLLNEFIHGRTAITIEFRREQEDGMIMWVRNVLHLVEDPNTVNILLYEYCYNINSTKSVEVVTGAAILGTYECLASIDLLHGQTTYLSQYNVRRGKKAVIKIYQDVLEEYIDKVVIPGDRETCWTNFAVENLRKHLDENESYEFIYHTMEADNKIHIMRCKFTYYDKKKYRCLMMVTDVTEIIEEEEEDRRRTELAHVMGDFPGGVMTFEAQKDENNRHPVIFCAKGVADLLGYELEEFIEYYKNDLSKLIFSSDINAITSQMDILANTGKPLDLTYRVFTKEGKILWLREFANLMEEEDGHKIIVAIFQNISEETKLYQKIIDDSDNAIQIIDKDTREVYYANAKAIEIAGIKNYAGMHCYEFFGHSDSPCSFCNYHDNTLEEKEVTLERLNKIFSVKGTFTEWHGRSVFIEDLLDITQHKKLQYDYESYTNSVLNMAMDAAIVGRINVTKNSIYNLISKYQAFSGIQTPCSTEEFVDYSITFIQDQEEKDTYKKIFNRENFIKQFRDGNNIIKYQHHCELLSGSIVIVESAAQLMLNPNNGDIEGVIYARDITQETISEQILKQLMDSGYEGVELIDTVTGSCSIKVLNTDTSRTDLTKIIDYAENCENAARYYIYHKDRELFLQASSIENIVSQLATQEKYSITVRNFVNDKLTYKRCTYSYLGYGKSTIMGTIEDVTNIVEETEHQKQELQKALRVSQLAAKAKDEFFSLMSHDMRTPLNGIIGLSYLLEEQNDLTTIKNYVVKLRNSGEYLLHLINDILDISKIESGKLELYPKVCSEEKIFTSILDMVVPMAKKKEIQFNFIKPHTQWQDIYVDEQRVKQIMINLLSNAIKYTKSQGKVDFSIGILEQQDTSIKYQFVVKDNGIGMSEEFLPHVFESFKQEGRSNKSTGSGLGMPIVKQLVDMMGGTIDIQSKIDEGTTVTVILDIPLANGNGDASSKKKVVVKLEELKDKRVLLCEDHPLNAFIAVQLLEKQGIQVTTASNGKLGVEAFEQSEEHYFDAILMDIRMPVMNGLDAAKAIRRLKRNDAQSVPIIALSANAFEEDRAASYDAGMNAHLSKPIQVKELYETLYTTIFSKRGNLRPLVLIVDDVEVNRAVITIAIEKEYDVIEAKNGAEALEMLKQHPEIAAIVTDLYMPVMDGIELTKKVRSNKAYDHIIMLVNSQYGEKEQIEELTALGVNEFIYKAVSPQIICMRLNSIMRHHTF